MSESWHAWRPLGKPGGWTHLHRLAVTQNQDGRQEVLAVCTDGSLAQVWQTTPNGGWSHWESRGKPTDEGIALSSPAVGKPLAVVRSQDGQLAAFAVAARSVWTVQQTAPNNGWGVWQSLGQAPGSGGVAALDVVPDHEGCLRLLTLGYTSRLAGRPQLQPDGDWGDWERDFPHDQDIPFRSFALGHNADGRLAIITDLSGVLALITQSEPGGRFRAGFGNLGITERADSMGVLSVAHNQDGTIEVAVTIDRRLVHLRQHRPNQLPSPGGGGWARHNLGRPAEQIAVDEPVLVANRHGRLEVFVRGSDGHVWHSWQTTPGGPWDAWHDLRVPGAAGSGVASLAVGKNQNGRLELFVIQQGELWHTWQTD